MFHITSYGVTDVGLERNNNEDAYHIAADAGLYVVCDGMGGHASGEIASSITVESMGEFVAKTIHESNFRWPFNSPTATTLETRILDCAVRLANREVFNSAQQDTKNRGMGTTIVAMLAGETQLGAVHVGDSRIYRLRDGKISPVTEDHSLLNHYLRTRPMTKEEIKNFKGKNVIVRAVGLREAVQPEVHVIDYRVGDRYLLCTDGLTDLVEDEDIEAEMISADNGMEGAVTRLIERALKAGGKDNVTIVMLQINAAGAGDEVTDESGLEDADDTSPGFDAADGDGYWDQETMPAYEVGDLAKAVIAGDPSALNDDGFASEPTPMDGSPATLPDVQPDHVIPPPPAGVADISAAETRDDIPAPPDGRAELPDPPGTPVADKGPAIGAQRSEVPHALVTTPSQPLKPQRLGGTTPPAAGRTSTPPAAESPFAEPKASVQVDDPAVVRAWDPTAPTPIPAVRIDVGAETDRQRQVKPDYNPATDVTPMAPMAAVVVSNKGVVSSESAEVEGEAGAAIQVERALHAKTSRYKAAGDSFNIDSPTPLAVPVIRPEDLNGPDPFAEPDDQGDKTDG